jgi:thymidylate synthase (FAD)
MPEVNLNVKLISYTPTPEKLTAMAAKLCYSPSSIDDIDSGLTDEKASAFIEKIVDIGHLSTIEHASFSFGIEGVSRTLLAQITRHRLASFSVQSQRYVSYSDGFSYIVPPSIRALGPDATARFEDQMATMQSWYDEWRTALGEKGEKSNQDARFVLPGACETKMILTMNARELQHFFSLRCCNRAQWEIRKLAWRMFALVSDVAPGLFQTAGPSCIRGKCSEGSKTCGSAKEIKEKQQSILKGKK